MRQAKSATLHFSLLILVALLLFFNTTALFAQTSDENHAVQSIRFAVIGDFGEAGPYELDVANLVKSWNPDLVITTGDNNYPNGALATIDTNIGQYYHEFIFPYSGSFGQGDTVHRFFPSLGNHDWNTPGALPYLNYFTLPGNERYYDFVNGPVHFFALDSDIHEPDGRTDTSIQAGWLETRLAYSTAPWKIVYFHHPPYSSGSTHGSQIPMRWPFATWGASAVLTGHEHNYERISADSIVYFVNGLGGRSTLYPFGTPIEGSQVRYNTTFGAMLVEAEPDSITFKFINIDTVLIDTHTLYATPVNVRENRHNNDFVLLQGYPNPFNPITTVTFLIPSKSFVTLQVTDILGKEVALLTSEELPAGKYTRQWDASGFASGVYLCRMVATSSAGTYQKTIELVYLR